MALVETQGLRLAIDRSLLGPQGRRWIERKLPDVTTNMACIVLYTFGACVLVYHICCDYNTLGSRGCLEMIPKHVFSAVAIHVVAIVLRWKIERMLRLSFRINDEGRSDSIEESDTRDEVLSHDNHVERSQSVEMVPAQEEATATVRTEAAVAGGDAGRDADGVESD